MLFRLISTKIKIVFEKYKYCWHLNSFGVDDSNIIKEKKYLTAMHL